MYAAHIMAGSYGGGSAIQRKQAELRRRGPGNYGIVGGSLNPYLGPNDTQVVAPKRRPTRGF